MLLRFKFYKYISFGIGLILLLALSAGNSQWVKAQEDSSHFTDYQSNFDTQLTFAQGLSTAYPDWLDVIPDCPCMAPTTDTENWELSNTALDYFHPGTVNSYRSKKDYDAAGIDPGQQCNYDASNKLITGGIAAGTPDLYSPSDLTNVPFHYSNDVKPFEILGWQIYTQYWPPNNGLSCPANVLTGISLSAPAISERSPGIKRLPDGTVGVKYSQTVSANGGAGGYTFEMYGGKFFSNPRGTPPFGLSIGTNGELTGTPLPSAAGKLFKFTVFTTDSAGRTGSQTYEIAIKPPSGGDISFVIDTTGSMADDIDAVKASATEIVNSIASTRSDVRFSIVLYRDAGDIYISTTLLDFTSNTAEVISKINSITVAGGGDEPEAVYSGLMHSIGLGWSMGAEKSIIWMGDAPPHDPDPNGYTYAQVVAAANAVDPAAPITISENEDAPSIASAGGIGTYAFGSGTGRFSLSRLVAYMMPSAQVSGHPIHIYPIVIGSSTQTLTVMQALANATGGQVFQAQTASDVVASILQALGVILSRITVPTTSTPSTNSSPVALPLCSDVAGNTNPIVRANIPSNTVGSGGVYCHVIAQNGQFNPAEIGNQNVLNLGVRHAVDVFSLDNSGSPITRFNGMISVCLQGTGSLIFLDAQQSPRIPQPLAVQSSGGFTCANLQTAGTLVLVNANVSAPAAPANSAPATIQALTNCTVTTTNMINLRSEPNTSSAEMTVLPYNISYQATEHVPGWYRIIYLNTQGWVSESYVHTQGNCG